MSYEHGTSRSALVAPVKGGITSVVRVHNSVRSVAPHPATGPKTSKRRVWLASPDPRRRAAIWSWTSSSTERIAAPAGASTAIAKASVGTAVYSTRLAPRTAKASSGAATCGRPVTAMNRLARRQVRHARVDRLALVGVDAGGAPGGGAAVGQVARLLLVITRRVAGFRALHMRGLVHRRLRLPQRALRHRHLLATSSLRPAGRARRSSLSKNAPISRQTPVPPVSPRQRVRISPTSA